MQKPEYRIAYMCATDFHHELGYALEGNKVYPSMEDCADNNPCAEQCGMVAVRIQLATAEDLAVWEAGSTSREGLTVQ